MKLPLIAILISVFTLSFCITHTIREPQEPNGYHLTLISVNNKTTFEEAINFGKRELNYVVVK